MTKTATAPLLDSDPGVKDVALVPADDSGSAVAMFERLARDPNASVEKIERLMALWERAEARKAESAFNAAMADAQKEMRPVAADSYNPSTKSKYASYEALDTALRPIYTKHGFALSFNTGESQPDNVRVLCDVSQGAGHSKRYQLDMPADGKGAKGGDVMTKTHATGAALSYGMRYLLKMIFNIAVGEGDDDGNSAGLKGERPTPPPGYETWWAMLESVAEGGTKAFDEAWTQTRDAGFKTYTVTHNKQAHADIKAKAAKAGRR